MGTLMPLLLVMALAVCCQGQAPPVCDLPDDIPGSPATVFVSNRTSVTSTTRGLKTVVKGRKFKAAIKEGREATKIDPLTWIVAVAPTWLDLCPERFTTITPPKWFVFMGQVCYTPFPFNTFSYPTAVCPFTRCRFIQRPLFYCRPDVRRVYGIPIYCYDPKKDKFVAKKYPIYTYRYCTCCRFGCVLIRAETADGS